MSVVSIQRWNRNDLSERFGTVCEMVMEDLKTGDFIWHMDDSIHMAAPLYDEANIPDIDRWWREDDHLARWIAALTELKKDIPTAMDDNIQAGLQQLNAYQHLYDEISSIDIDDGWSILKYIPHIAQYSQLLNDTPSFGVLSDFASTADIAVLPHVTIGTRPTCLKNAFSLNIVLMVMDQTPINPKLQRLVVR